MLARTHSASLWNLISNLREDSKAFIRQEVRLAKTEMSEKVSAMGRNATFVAAGGFVAATAAVLLFVGISFVLSFAFEKWGLSHDIALFTGPLAMAVLTGLIGFILIEKGLHAFSETKLKPEKALETLKGEEAVHAEQLKEKAKEKTEQAEQKVKVSSNAIKTVAEQTRENIEETVSEIKHRMSPRHMKDVVVTKVRSNPMPVAAIALSSVMGIWFMWRRRAHKIVVGEVVCKAS